MTSSGDDTVSVTPESDQDRDPAAIFGWIYLGLIMALFIAMALWAFRVADSDGTATVITDQAAATATTATTAPPVLEATVIDVTIDRKIATVTGTVPDEGARNQLVRISEQWFGNGNVIDELTVDDSYGLAGGTINFTGIADEGDQAPEQLQLTAAADLGLSTGTFDVEFVQPQFEPAAVNIDVAQSPVIVTGRVPSESDRDRLLQSVEAVYGEGQADVSGVVVESSDLDGADFTLAGLTKPGDTRSGDLVAILQTDFRSVVVTNSSEVDVSDEALTEFEAQLAATLVENPILFDTGTSTISEEGQANLLIIAEAIVAVPGRDVQIIGHTDDTGGDAVNQVLSENRALAVKDALVELGIEEARLTTEGLGASDPAVPNTSAENRARNRRIEFLFERG